MSELQEPEPSLEDLAKLQLLTSMRIYDVLMTLLDEANSTRQEELMDIHDKFGFVCNPPWQLDEVGDGD